MACAHLQEKLATSLLDASPASFHSISNLNWKFKLNVDTHSGDAHPDVADAEANEISGLGPPPKVVFPTANAFMTASVDRRSSSLAAAPLSSPASFLAAPRSCPLHDLGNIKTEVASNNDDIHYSHDDDSLVGVSPSQRLADQLAQFSPGRPTWKALSGRRSVRDLTFFLDTPTATATSASMSSSSRRAGHHEFGGPLPVRTAFLFGGRSGEPSLLSSLLKSVAKVFEKLTGTAAPGTKTVQAKYEGACMYKPAMAAWDMGKTLEEKKAGALAMGTKGREGVAQCVPGALKEAHLSLHNAIEEAQALVLRGPKSQRFRFFELQRIQDAASFLWRSDVSHLTKEEVCDLGQAMRAAELAGYKARTEIDAPLKDSERGVPVPISDAIGAIQTLVKAVAAHGYNCQVSTF